MTMPPVSRARAVAIVLALVGVLVLVGRTVARSDPGDAEPPEPARLVVESTPGATTGPAGDEVVVHVVGAVRRPGLVRVSRSARVADAIERAGGVTRRAAIELVNLAAPVADGQQVSVPLRAAVSAGPAAAPGAPGGAAAVGPVNLNAATVEQLDALPGIGPVTAQNIVDYRAEHGPFRTVDDLDQIPGIGPARLEQLRELVAV